MKYTPDDIKRLAQFMRGSKDHRPFSLLTGAGCSKSAGIPLASELVQRIVEDDRFEPHIASLPVRDRQNYGRLMSCLGRNERKELLEPYLSNAKVNWANIAISSMMNAGYVGRVLTFNFDNILARAAGICGVYPATYDYVTGVSQTTDHIVTPSVIHLHGQGYGLAMLNSAEETQEHAERLRPLIRDTLLSSPILVVGYSGLSDAVFPIIKSEFRGDERLFWASYETSIGSPIRELLQKNSQLTTHLGGADADLFLVELAQELSCWPPLLFVDPVAHIRNEIEPITQFPVTGKGPEVVDVLAALQRRLTQIAADPTAEDPGLRAMVLMLKGDHDAVIEAKKSGDDVPDEFLNAALVGKGRALARKAEESGDAALYDGATELFKHALEVRPDDNGTLSSWGEALSDKAKATGETALFDAAFEKYEAALKVKPDDSDTLHNWGIALSKKAEATGETALCDAAFEKFEAALKIKPDDSDMLNNWGIALSAKAEATGETALFDAAFEKFEAALKIKPDDSDMLQNWGVALLAKAEATGETALFDAAFEKFEAALKVKSDDSATLNRWGIALSDKAKATGETALFDAAFEKFEAALKVKPDDSDTLNNWGIALSKKAEATGEPSLLDAAFEKCEAALKIKPIYAYNMACICALRGDIEGARRHLETCRSAKTLPPKSHLESDADMESLRKLEWFTELVEGR